MTDHNQPLRNLWRWRWCISLIALAAHTQMWGALLAIGGVWMLESYRNWEDDWDAFFNRTEHSDRLRKVAALGNPGADGGEDCMPSPGVAAR